MARMYKEAHTRRSREGEREDETVSDSERWKAEEEGVRLRTTRHAAIRYGTTTTTLHGALGGLAGWLQAHKQAGRQAGRRTGSILPVVEDDIRQRSRKAARVQQTVARTLARNLDTH